MKIMKQKVADKVAATGYKSMILRGRLVSRYMYIYTSICRDYLSHICC